MFIAFHIGMCTDADEFQVAAADKLNWETRFGYDAIRVKGLVDFQLYCDGCATCSYEYLYTVTHVAYTQTHTHAHTHTHTHTRTRTFM